MVGLALFSVCFREFVCCQSSVLASSANKHRLCMAFHFNTRPATNDTASHRDRAPSPFNSAFVHGMHINARRIPHISDD